jgi:integrase
MTRKYAEGSFYQRKDGRWVAKFADPATGKSRYRYAKDEKAARRVLSEMTRRAAIGDPVADRRVTLKRYAEQWLEDRAGRRRAESTLYEYESRLRLHVYPAFGHLKLSALTIDMVEKWMDDLLDKGLKPSTVRSIRNTFAAVLSDAVRARALAVNVARLAEAPTRAQVAPPKVTPASTTATRSLLAVADRDDAEIGRFLRVISSTGCRPGEAAAARWDDLDLDRGLWSIERTMTRDRKGRSVVGESTKTRQARQARLPGLALEALRDQRREVLKRQLSAKLWVDEAYVWPTSIGTAPDLHNLRKRIRAVAKSAGFEGSAMSLRHLFASIAAESVELTVVSKLMGHRRTSTTSDTYAHLRPETRDAVADSVERAIAEQASGSD